MTPLSQNSCHTKEGAEIDFALSRGNVLTHLIECKWADDAPYKAFAKFMPFWPQAQAVQLVRYLRSPELRNGARIVAAAPWLAELAA